MKLKKIQIKNYRSIKYQELSFDRNFQLLVGINESGKTNLIKAVSLLNDEILFTKDDIRDPGHDEDAVTESYVRFVFKIESLLLDEYIKSVECAILASDLSVPLLDINNSVYDIRGFCKHKNEVLYVVNLLKESRSGSHWSLTSQQYKIYPNWKKIKQGSSYPFVHNGESLNISNYSIVNVDDFSEIPESFLEDLNIKSLNTIVGDHLVNISKDYYPTCILWTYSEDNLLPANKYFSIY